MLPLAKKIDQIQILMLYEVSKILCSSLALDQLALNRTLNQVLELIATHLGMQRGMISLEQEPGMLKTTSSIGLTHTEMQRAVFKIGEGITGKIFQHGLPMVIPDIADEPLFLNKTGAYHHLENSKISFLGVPIKVGAQCIGVMSFQFEKAEHFAGFQTILSLLNMVTRLIGQTVQLNQQISRERQQLLLENAQLQNELNKTYTLDNAIGKSKSMQEVFSKVHMAAPGNSTILLRGESGTGKEVIARAIHALSSRNDAPFIKINCAALSEQLLESELFGHEKGAFTGALQQRIGRFEQANKGTLFLDEIGDISPAFQVKLLRVLQEREFERVGGNTTIKVDVRLICATNRNLEEDVILGKFRADLYFRINVISIHLPALRERKEDIPLLAEHILNLYNQENKVRKYLSPAAMEILVNCQWPGNVRELENCLARSCTLSQSNLIQARAFPCQTNQCMSAALWKKPPLSPILAESKDDSETLDERVQLIETMEKHGWVQAKAARALKLTPRQIGYALKKHNITVKKF